MFALRLPSASKAACAAAVGLLLFAPASYAQGGRQQQVFPRGAYGNAEARTRAQYFSSPQDYASSAVCINGYRWITRQLDSDSSPAQNAIPVRC